MSRLKIADWVEINGMLAYSLSAGCGMLMGLLTDWSQLAVCALWMLGYWMHAMWLSKSMQGLRVFERCAELKSNVRLSDWWLIHESDLDEIKEKADTGKD